MKTLIPKDSERYLETLRRLGLVLQSTTSAVIVADSCRMVLNQAHGSPWKAIYWLARVAITRNYDRIKRDLWWRWERHIRLRTDDEITELLDADLERATGCDFREWPDEITAKEITNAGH